MEMDEMELDRYITGMLDTEHRNMKKDLRADKNKRRKTGGNTQDETGKQLVETDR